MSENFLNGYEVTGGQATRKKVWILAYTAIRTGDPVRVVFCGG